LTFISLSTNTGDVNIGGTENTGVENAGLGISARSSIGKGRGWKMREWKNRHGNPGGGKYRSGNDDRFGIAFHMRSKQRK